MITEKLSKLFEKQHDELSSSIRALSLQSLTDAEFKHTCNEFVKLLQTCILSPTEQSHTSSIFFTGIGKNDTIAKKSANMLRSLSIQSHHLSSVDAVHGDMGVIQTGDTIVAISKSGNTHELIQFLEYVNNTLKIHVVKNIKIVGIQIGAKRSKFNDVCDIVINLPDVNEIDDVNIVPTTSNILTQLFIDAISVYTVESSGIHNLEHFKISHPGGDIGKRSK